MKELEEFRQWLTTLNYNKQKIYLYPRSVEQFLKWSGKELRQITKADAMNYFEHLKTRTFKGKPLSKSYINSELVGLKAFARFLHQNNKRLFPVSHLISCKVEQRPPNYLTEDEVQAIYNVTTNSKYGYRDRAMLALCYGGGLRRSEAINLHVKDIDIRRGYVHVRDGKNYKERIVPLPPKAITHIKEYLKHGRPLLQKGIHYQRELFLGYRGTSIKSQVFEKRIRVLAELTENRTLIDKKVTMHLLRHSIATHLLQRGVALEQLSKFLGHSSLDSTQIYTHIIPYNDE
jgi:integrase/recombinase XerD